MLFTYIIIKTLMGWKNQKSGRIYMDNAKRTSSFGIAMNQGSYKIEKDSKLQNRERSEEEEDLNSGPSKKAKTGEINIDIKYCLFFVV